MCELSALGNALAEMNPPALGGAAAPPSWWNPPSRSSGGIVRSTVKTGIELGMTISGARSPPECSDIVFQVLGGKGVMRAAGSGGRRLHKLFRAVERRDCRSGSELPAIGRSV